MENSQGERRHRPYVMHLREWRQHKGWSQEELARQAGVSTSTVTRAERRSTEPQQDVIRKLTLALGLDIHGLESPPPGFPDFNEQCLIDLFDAITTLTDDVNGVGDNVTWEEADHSEEAAFARWALKRARSIWPSYERPWGSGDLQDAARFLETLADELDDLEEREAQQRTDIDNQATPAPTGE